MFTQLLSKLPEYWQGLLFDFLVRFRQERVHIIAGYLAYVSLMSLVPLMVVMFSVMTAFPLFAEIKVALENFVYNNFLPTSSQAIQQHIGGFVNNASKMSVVALSFLFLFAMLLMSAIDKSVNHIWQVKKKRRWITSFSIYWLVLTLGPILASVSIALSSYVISLVPLSVEESTSIGRSFLYLLPFIVSSVTFCFLFLAVPNTNVAIKYAAIGAVISAILFEVAKKLFAIYVLALPSYQAIYGALATIPILFLWVYLSWLIVLTGVVLTVTLQKQDEKLPATPSEEGFYGEGNEDVEDA